MAAIKMEAKPTTRLAVLRTMGALHAQPLRYDLESLRSIVLHLSPDLVCAEITREAWESNDLSRAPLEIREALAPVIAQTDIVLIPIAPSQKQFTDYQSMPGWRHSLSQQFDRLLQWGQRVANRPEAIHGKAFQLFCHTVCALNALTWNDTDRAEYQAHNKALAENILEAIRRDPGGRVLVVVQCQWYHSLEPTLRQLADWVEIVDYPDL